MRNKNIFQIFHVYVHTTNEKTKVVKTKVVLWRTNSLTFQTFRNWSYYILVNFWNSLWKLNRKLSPISSSLLLKLEFCWGQRVCRDTIYGEFNKWNASNGGNMNKLQVKNQRKFLERNSVKLAFNSKITIELVLSNYLIDWRVEKKSLSTVFKNKIAKMS